jgi:hypothetical protein
MDIGGSSFGDFLEVVFILTVLVFCIPHIRGHISGWAGPKKPEI